MVEVSFSSYTLGVFTLLAIEVLVLGGMMIDMVNYHADLDKVSSDLGVFMADYTYMPWPNLAHQYAASYPTDYIRYVADASECRNDCESTTDCDSYTVPLNHPTICVLKKAEGGSNTGSSYHNFFDRLLNDYYNMGYTTWIKSRKPIT